MKELAARREEKQPLNIPAGSTFKRPQGYFAGKPIEDVPVSGDMGRRRQGIGEALRFVINGGNATASGMSWPCVTYQKDGDGTIRRGAEMEVKRWGNS